MTPAEQAQAFLFKIVQKHNQELQDAREETSSTLEDQFLYGQDFDVEPEVWDTESEDPGSLLRYL